MKSIEEMARRTLWRNGIHFLDRRSHEFCVEAKRVAQHEEATREVRRHKAWRNKCR